MKIKVAATQMSVPTFSSKQNIEKAVKMVRDAAKAGANIILLQELFETPYFCQIEDYDYFKLAHTFENANILQVFSALAKELSVVLPISFFEKDVNVHFNSIAIIDADGQIVGKYRKTHIPDGHQYEEKFYFTPGDNEYKVFQTKFGKIGVAICWDQWFPEVARILTLLGAEILFYPTAIGSEPVLDKDSKNHWQNAMKGHAAANIIPVVASNRIGTESVNDSSMTFFGSSFIAGDDGEKIVELNRTEEGFIIAEFDLDQINHKRISWGVFRDRRPDLYKRITKL